MSVSVICLSLLGIIALITYKRQYTVSLWPVWLCIAFYLLSSLAFAWSENRDDALQKLTVKLPLLVLPFIYCYTVSVSDKIKSYVALIFCYAIYLPAMVSSINYFRNKALFDILVLQSKPIPVEFGYGIHHIEFSILCALSVLVGLYWFFNDQLYKHNKFTRYSFLIFSLANLAAMHILSARTGLLGLYAALAAGVLIYIFKKRPLRQSVLVLLIAICLPVGAYLMSGSLRNRVSNSIEDLRTVTEGKDANEHSFAMRVEAWKTAKVIIKKHPLSGVGIGDAQAAMQKQYEQNHSHLETYNRKNPHNQFLETAVQSGIPAAVLLLLLLLFPLFYKAWRHNMLVVCTIVLYLVSLQFESVLEMQAGVIPFVFFYFFILGINRKEGAFEAES